MSRLFLVILLLCGSASVVLGQRSVSATPQSLKVFRSVKGFEGEPIGVPTTIEFNIGALKYRLRSDGRGRRYGRSGLLTRKFRLPLAQDEEIARLYVSEYGGDFVFVYEFDSGTSGAGYIARLDGQTLKPKWKTLIPGFNVGQGLLVGNHAYLIAFGFVGKLNLRSGRYTWRIDDLYQDNDVFNSFETPSIKGDIVAFKDKSYNKPAVTLEVNKHSGKIVNITPPMKLIKRRRSPGEFGGVSDH